MTVPFNFDSLSLIHTILMKLEEIYIKLQTLQVFAWFCYFCLITVSFKYNGRKKLPSIIIWRKWSARLMKNLFTVKSRRCSVKKVFLKISLNSQKSEVKLGTLLKKKLRQRCFLVSVAKILRVPFRSSPEKVFCKKVFFSVRSPYGGHWLTCSGLIGYYRKRRLFSRHFKRDTPNNSGFLIQEIKVHFSGYSITQQESSIYETTVNTCLSVR